MMKLVVTYYFKFLTFFITLRYRYFDMHFITLLPYVLPSGYETIHYVLLHVITQSHQMIKITFTEL